MLLAISTIDVKGKVISWFFVSVFGLLHRMVLFYFSMVRIYYLEYERAVRPSLLYHAAC